MKTNKEKIDIPTSFARTLNKSDLTALSSDILELKLDSFLSNGVLKEIPVIRTMIALVKTGVSIQNVLFNKKLIVFLSQIHNTRAADRKKMIDKIDSSKKFRIRVGEKLLYLIDKSDDWTNSELIGRLFKLFIDKKINYEQFVVCAEIISRVSNQELGILKKSKDDEFSAYKLSTLATSGFFTVEFEQGDIHNEGDPPGVYSPQHTKLTVVDSDVYYKINSYGKIVRSIL